MIFDALYASAQRGELLCIDGGICHWHLRRDGQLTIQEIIATAPGAGSRMLAILLATLGAIQITAKCLTSLPSNGWYARMGFSLVRTEQIRTGRTVNVWMRSLGGSTAPLGGGGG